MKQSVLIGLIVMVAVGALIALGLYLQTSSETLKVPLPLTITHERISYDVDASSNVSAVTQNDFARHRFTVKQSGELVDLLTQKIYPHVAVVSDDLKDVTFYHVDKLSTPEDGIYEFDHLFTAPSDYSLWFELNDNTTEDHHGEKSNYIAKVLVVNSNQSADEVIQTETRGIAIDRNYRLQLNQTSFTAGTPSTLRIEIADTGNEPLSIYKDYEQHFFYAVNPITDFYALDHFDENLSTEASVAVPFTFPTPGKYAFWARIFLSDGAGTPIDFVEGAFVVEAR